MRRFLSVALIAAALASTQAYAQEEEATTDGTTPEAEATPPDDDVPVVKKEVRPQNVITTNPLNFLFGTYSLEYERVLMNNLSAFISPTYVNLTLVTTIDGSEVRLNLNGFGVNAGARYYFNNEAPAGFFAAPQAHFYSSTGSTNVVATTVSQFSFGAGVMGGYAWLLGNVFDISIGAGGGLQHTTTTYRTPGEPDTTQAGAGFLLLLRLNLGFAF